MNKDGELTPAERKALEALSGEMEPSPFLEERVVGELRQRGAVQPGRRRTLELTGWRMASAAAAGLLLVLVGFGLGRVSTGSGGQEIPAVVNGDLAVAYSLQRAGTAYVLAIGDLAAVPGTAADPGVRQGREIALTTLFTAAGEMAKVVPREQLAEQILLALEVPGLAVPVTREEDETTREIWF